MSSYQRLGGTLGGSGGGATPSASSLGSQDASSKGGLYLVEDFNEVYSTTSPRVSNFFQNPATQAGCGTSGIVLPSAELAVHPGVCSVYSSGSGTGYAQVGAANGTIPAYSTSPVTTTWNITFRSPSLASTATDSYLFMVGNFTAQLAAFCGTGVGIAVTDAQNGGNWRMFTVYPANEVVQYTNTAAPFVAGTWQALQIVQSGSSFAISLNGNALGSVSDPNFTSTFLWQLSAGSMFLQRTAFAASTPPAIIALMDRAAVYMTGLGR